MIYDRNRFNGFDDDDRDDGPATIPIPLVNQAEKLFFNGFMPDEWVTEGIRSISRREGRSIEQDATA